MARENKFASSGGAKETPPGKLMEMIVEDVITAKTMTFAQWHALSSKKPHLVWSAQKVIKLLQTPFINSTC